MKHISFTPLGWFRNTLWQRSNPGHRVMAHSVLHIPVRYPFTITFTSAEKLRLCSKGKGYVFIPICWFVCLLAILRESAWTDFMKVAGRTWYKEQSRAFWVCSIYPLAYMISLSIFSGESVSVSKITEKKRLHRLSWNFQDRSNMRQETVLIDFYTSWVQTY